VWWRSVTSEASGVSGESSSERRSSGEQQRLSRRRRAVENEKLSVAV
jgi:hypothetical protein